MAEQLFSLKTLSRLSLFFLFFLMVITEDFRTVSQAVKPKYRPNLIIMCLELDFASPALLI